jgi:hypothetical protein
MKLSCDYSCDLKKTLKLIRRNLVVASVSFAHQIMLRLLVFVVHAILSVAAYQRGDVVSTLARTQYAGWRMPWTEVARSEMPKFREPSIVWLAPPVPREGDDADATKAFQLSLAFSESRFVVPWVSTRTQHGEAAFRLRYLKVTFLYSGSDILQVGGLVGTHARPSILFMASRTVWF